MNFPVMNIREATEAFTAIVYGERLDFHHA
jgi:hypothetical protein